MVASTPGHTLAEQVDKEWRVEEQRDKYIINLKKKTGRYVRLQMAGSGQGLALGEVQVMGK